MAKRYSRDSYKTRVIPNSRIWERHYNLKEFSFVLLFPVLKSFFYKKILGSGSY